MLLLLWLINRCVDIWNPLRTWILRIYDRPRFLQRDLFLLSFRKQRSERRLLGRRRKQTKMELERYDSRTSVRDGNVVHCQRIRKNCEYYCSWDHDNTISFRPHQAKVCRRSTLLTYICGPSSPIRINHMAFFHSLNLG